MGVWYPYCDMSTEKAKMSHQKSVKLKAGSNDNVNDIWNTTKGMDVGNSNGALLEMST